MKVEIRNGKVHISGYVNAVGRDSRPILSPTGEFVEMIEPGTFAEALTRAENVDILLDHDPGRRLGGTKQGNLTLKEDTIGLHAECEISDAEVMRAAKNGDLRGWSFGMYVNDDELEPRINDIPRRHVRNLDIFEVSLIDSRMTPAYAGTSVECRAEKRVLTETRTTEDAAELIGSDELDKWQKRVNELSLKVFQDRVDELRKIRKDPICYVPWDEE